MGAAWCHLPCPPRWCFSELAAHQNSSEHLEEMPVPRSHLPAVKSESLELSIGIFSESSSVHINGQLDSGAPSVVAESIISENRRPGDTQGRMRSSSVSCFDLFIWGSISRASFWIFCTSWHTEKIQTFAVHTKVNK